MQQKLWTISELAEEYQISTRSIRFYEDKGLLEPQRVGANRVYSYKDHARLKLILRGKRLGFSLEEIKEFIGLYNTELDPELTGQLQFLLTNVQDKLSILKQQQLDLAMTLDELEHIKSECLKRLVSRTQ
ncbi:MerR family transcriptional regulator [Thiothrix eikelboomii]|uniref:DNA-binding transcriptional regulator, MerR family n=1 Tax=Thiothrix eikelboomii TaxID=92487 RepID=A0A1T4WQE7_9GAMM|nr:MerR family DNA-binding transcriptional regulator [Thiothrix eikelboomii]SKA79546.1 DNA-binding transcriptional regulator, MerR family [Thiothrix eikelboomii]